MAAKLLREFLENKGGKKMSKLESPAIENHSTLFSATFYETVEAVVLADPGSDDNLMLPRVFRKILLANKDAKVENLAQPIKFSMAVNASGPDGTNAYVTCRKSVHADANLRIRHGSSLMLRNVRWVVSDQVADQVADHVLLGGPLLEALGLNTKNILQLHRINSMELLM